MVGSAYYLPEEKRLWMGGMYVEMMRFMLPSKMQCLFKRGVCQWTKPVSLLIGIWFFFYKHKMPLITSTNHLI